MATKKTTKKKASTPKVKNAKGKAATPKASSGAPKPATSKQASGLDAAAQVLKDAKQPMRCRDIVKTMLDNGMWKTNGATPHATIYAAMIREIAAKGTDARFKKTDRGLFTTNT